MYQKGCQTPQTAEYVAIPFFYLHHSPTVSSRFHVHCQYLHYIEREIFRTILDEVTESCSHKKINMNINVVNVTFESQPISLPRSFFSQFRLIGAAGGGKLYLLAALMYHLTVSYRSGSICFRPLYIFGGRLNIETLKECLLVSFLNEKSQWCQIYSISDVNSANQFLQGFNNFLLIVDESEKIPKDDPLFLVIQKASRIHLDAVTAKYPTKHERSKYIKVFQISGSASKSEFDKFMFTFAQSLPALKPGDCSYYLDEVVDKSVTDDDCRTCSSNWIAQILARNLYYASLFCSWNGSSESTWSLEDAEGIVMKEEESIYEQLCAALNSSETKRSIMLYSIFDFVAGKRKHFFSIGTMNDYFSMPYYAAAAAI